jgi:hypothetical protein
MTVITAVGLEMSLFFLSITVCGAAVGRHYYSLCPRFNYRSRKKNSNTKAIVILLYYSHVGSVSSPSRWTVACPASHTCPVSR